MEEKTRKKEAEKQRLQKILSRFSQSNSDIQKLTNLMIKGVKENQTYKKIQDLLSDIYHALQT